VTLGLHITPHDPEAHLRLLDVVLYTHKKGWNDGVERPLTWFDTVRGLPLRTESVATVLETYPPFRNNDA
jgi:hypothetical protein